MIPSDSAKPNSALVEIDARKSYRKPSFESKGGILPDILKEYIPFKISRGYCASYLWSKDRKTLLAYIYNTTHHINLKKQDLVGKLHRMPVPADLRLTFLNLPKTKLNYRVYDLSDKVLIKQGIAAENTNLGISKTDNDYFILITTA